VALPRVLFESLPALTKASIFAGNVLQIYPIAVFKWQITVPRGQAVSQIKAGSGPKQVCQAPENHVSEASLEFSAQMPAKSKQR
jgi:hypothetical protein